MIWWTFWEKELHNASEKNAFTVPNFEQRDSKRDGSNRTTTCELDYSH